MKKNTTSIKNYAEGHRKRLKEKLTHSLYTMHDYEILEILLTYVIPRKDTKNIAKAIIEHFQGISGILCADLKELMQIKGVGKEVATFLLLQAEIFRLYWEEPSCKQNKNISDVILNELICSNISQNIPHAENEIWLICLNAQYNFLNCKYIDTLKNCETYTDILKIVEIAKKCSSPHVLLFHTVLNTKNVQSVNFRLLSKLKQNLEDLEINLLDYSFVTENKCVSVLGNNLNFYKEKIQENLSLRTLKNNFIEDKNTLKKKLLESKYGISNKEALILLLTYVEKDITFIDERLSQSFINTRACLCMKKSELEYLFNDKGKISTFLNLQKEIFTRYFINSYSKISNNHKKAPVLHVEDFVYLAHSRLASRDKEEVCIAYLDKFNTFLAFETVIQGDISCTSISPRNVVDNILKHKTCSKIFLSHNHPSGNPENSKADKALTKKINNTLKNLNIELLEHVIITDKSCNLMFAKKYIDI